MHLQNKNSSQQGAIKSTIAAACLVAFSPITQAGVELINVKNEQGNTKVEIGGYAKVDVRHVSGDVAYQDYWLGNFPGGTAINTSTTGFNVKESRLNFKVTHGEVTGFVELDFYGGGGNEVVSNSSSPRLRHFYISYKNWMVGQNWSTFMPLAALPESLDFGGPHVGEVFIRQTQIRYTHGNWQFAIENPETNGDGDIGAPGSAVGVSGTAADPDESIPDFVARYNMKGDWGQISMGGLFRKVDQGGIDDTAIAANVSGRIKTVGKDDFRFQITLGEPGRYVAPAMTPDIVINTANETVAEETTAFVVAYRHFWSESTRSTFYYGAAETDTLERKRHHFAANVVTDITAKLNAGVELGQYAVHDEGINNIESTYLQASLKYSF